MHLKCKFISQHTSGQYKPDSQDKLDAWNKENFLGNLIFNKQKPFFCKSVVIKQERGSSMFALAKKRVPFIGEEAGYIQRMDEREGSEKGVKGTY